MAWWNVNWLLVVFNIMFGALTVVCVATITWALALDEARNVPIDRGLLAHSRYQQLLCTLRYLLYRLYATAVFAVGAAGVYVGIINLMPYAGNWLPGVMTAPSLAHFLWRSKVLLNELSKTQSAYLTYLQSLEP